jgi:signal peptidase I
MQPAYEVGQELEVDTAAYEDAAPRPDDVVLFRAPRGIEEGACGTRRRPRQPCPRPTPPSRDIRLLGRVIAGPGDEVAFREGIAVVDGQDEQERQLLIEDPDCELCELPVEITVPGRHVFVAGDNRSEAADSRAFGPIPYSSIEGRVKD